MKDAGLRACARMVGASESRARSGMVDLGALPRLLIVNVEPLHEDSATGLTALSLLREWPKCQLAQLYTHPVAPDLEFCDRSMRVGCSMRGFLPHSRRSNDNVMAETYRARRLLQFAQRAHARPGDASRLSERVGNRMRQLYCLGRVGIDENLIEWIEAFAPDVIYTMLYDLDIMTLVLGIAERFGIPVMPHFMDDWPLTLRQRSVLYRLLDRWWRRRLQSVMSHTPIALTISQAMAAEFTKRYGRPMVPFMYCIEREELHCKPRRSPASEVTRFTYVGGLHLNRWRVLREIGLAMQGLANEGVRLEALIYAHPRRLEFYKKHLTVPPVMRVVGYLPHREVTRAQEDTDWLLHVESFEDWDRSFTRLSLSSKLPEYLAAGRPIFAYGPSEAASMRYISELGCGLVVGEQDRERLRSALRKAAMSRQLQETLGEISLDAARTRHDGPSERRRFQRLVENIVGDWRIKQTARRLEQTRV